MSTPLPSERPEFSHEVALYRLPRSTTRAIEAVASDGERRAVAGVLDAQEVGKLRLEGELSPDGPKGWRFDGTLIASVVQSCVLTLEPVVTKVRQKVARRYLPHVRESIESDLDDQIDPLPEVLDLGALAMEELALALPLYPRKEGAELEPATQPDTADDEKPNPFAQLAALKDKLQG